MRKNKLFALFMSGLMAVSAMPVFSASAEEYALGDIDMDGVITEHDAGMLYRVLDEKEGILSSSEYDKAAILSKEQLALADINKDGTVNYLDADIILEKSEYQLGDINMDGEVNVDDACLLLQEYACCAAQLPATFTLLQENLADTNANMQGSITVDDGNNILSMYTLKACGYSELAIYQGYNAEHNYFAYPENRTVIIK